MKLFSEAKRTDLGPRDHAEPRFSYLDRSARPEFGRIRNVLENWYQEFPDENRDLYALLRSTDDNQSNGALFELYLHRLLLNLGYYVTVHPETETGKRTRPDFIVWDESGRVYVEAVSATDSTYKDRASEARKQVVYRAIEQISCPSFYLSLDVEGDPETPPSSRKLCRFLQTWLDSLNPDHFIEREANFESLPRRTWEHDGWRITFTAVPRSPKRGTNSQDRLIGALMSEPRWIATWQSIRTSIVAKGKRYGKLGKPLVVAVNVKTFHLDRIEEMQALFGQEGYVFSVSNADEPPRMIRRRNGVWYGPQGVQYTRISAVLIAKEITPWTVAERNLTLYLNPWAEQRLSGPLCKLDRFMPGNGEMIWVTGKHPRKILGLGEGWPGKS